MHGQVYVPGMEELERKSTAKPSALIYIYIYIYIILRGPVHVPGMEELERKSTAKPSAHYLRHLDRLRAQLNGADSSIHSPQLRVEKYQ